MSSTPRLIDISQPVSPRSGTWPGDMPFAYKWTWSLQKGESCNVAAVRMSPHVGTHADAPLHFLADAPSIGEMELERYCGPCWVLDGPRDRHVEAEDLAAVDTSTHPRILVRTLPAGSTADPDVFSEDFVALTPGAAEWLHEHNASLIGLDTPSMDPFDSKGLPAHKSLAAAQIAILENLVLGHVEPGPYELFAFPLKWEGLDASPVRAVLRSLA